MITLIIMTDGRANYIEESIDSLSNLHGNIDQFVIHDDSGSDSYHEWLKWRYGAKFELHFTPGRSGFAGAYNSAWAWLRQNCRNDWIFFTEDDFVYTRPVMLNSMISVMRNNPNLAQMALRRQPWNDIERAAGGIVEALPEAYTDKTDGTNNWLEHRMFFTTNPSLIRDTLIHARDWPKEDHSEGIFGTKLFRDTEMNCAYWGARDSGEWCYHIGNERAGNGY